MDTTGEDALPLHAHLRIPLQSWSESTLGHVCGIAPLPISPWAADGAPLRSGSERMELSCELPRTTLKATGAPFHRA